ncbi:MAG TPA: phosphate ABC transporter permease PstA [Pseudonocardiaceae bacterium]|jgi:phosphate transport system permease protein|nr:phosphate ABC transporter permease PstA [Pseudonocardiaceae bacterium]
MATLADRAGTQPLRRATGGERSSRAVLFLLALWLSLCTGLVFLVVLVAQTLVEGLPRLDANLVTNYTSLLYPEQAGFRAAILGTVWVIGCTALLAIPLGVAAAIYLEEFADNERWYTRLIEVNIQNLAAVPTIIYGLLTLGILGGLQLVLDFQNRNVVIGGALALALLILPVIIIATRESLRAVPAEIRAGSLALGATPWQTVWRQTLPAAIPGIATGTIIALSRAIGEAAPLLLLGAVVFIRYDPNGLLSGFTTMPVQIYNLVAQPQEELRTAAAAGIVALLALLLLMNGVAILIRNKFQRRW